MLPLSAIEYRLSAGSCAINSCPNLWCRLASATGAVFSRKAASNLAAVGVSGKHDPDIAIHARCFRFSYFAARLQLHSLNGHNLQSTPYQRLILKTQEGLRLFHAPLAWAVGLVTHT